MGRTNRCRGHPFGCFHRYLRDERQDIARASACQGVDGRVRAPAILYEMPTDSERRRPWGFVIPLAIYIAISFPPLIGQEVVAMFCGMIWGLGEGFGIVAAGTVIGEILLFLYVFLWKRTVDLSADLLQGWSSTSSGHGCRRRKRLACPMLAMLASYAKVAG